MCNIITRRDETLLVIRFQKRSSVINSINFWKDQCENTIGKYQKRVSAKRSNYYVDK